MVLTTMLELLGVALCKFLQLFLLFRVTIVPRNLNCLLDAVRIRTKGQSLPRRFASSLLRIEFNSWISFLGTFEFLNLKKTYFFSVLI